MASSARLSELAENDVVEAARWIAKDNKAAARGLRETVVRAAARIGDFPHIGVLRPDLASDKIRFVFLTGYPYVIVYNATRTPPLILRVLHGARDLPDLLHGL
ncbi:MAG TPA: type II toxin-antitoxin system RelE/ParE family toxin [Rhizomicrobium sp.]|jgi:toxin ParE1/3/4